MAGAHEQVVAEGVEGDGTHGVRIRALPRRTRHGAVRLEEALVRVRVRVSIEVGVRARVGVGVGVGVRVRVRVRVRVIGVIGLGQACGCGGRSSASTHMSGVVAAWRTWLGRGLRLGFGFGFRSRVSD